MVLFDEWNDRNFSFYSRPKKPNALAGKNPGNSVAWQPLFPIYAGYELVFQFL
jgi:hypothetical protein